MIIVSAIFLHLLFERLESKSLDLGVTSTSKDVDSTGEMAETMIKALKSIIYVILFSKPIIWKIPNIKPS